MRRIALDLDAELTAEIGTDRLPRGIGETVGEGEISLSYGHVPALSCHAPAR
jgi:hypothetical protein